MKYLFFLMLPIVAQAKSLYGVVISCPVSEKKEEKASCPQHVKYVAASDIEAAIKLAKKNEPSVAKIDKFETMGELVE